MTRRPTDVVAVKGRVANVKVSVGRLHSRVYSIAIAGLNPDGMCVCGRACECVSSMRVRSSEGGRRPALHHGPQQATTDREFVIAQLTERQEAKLDAK